jgi:RNA polymerase sigma-70 factor (ECF subfamily)
MRIIRNLAIERFRRADVVRFDQGALLAALDVADHAPTPDVVAMDRSELNMSPG